MTEMYKYEKYVVAFADILGFSEFVRQSSETDVLRFYSKFHEIFSKFDNTSRQEIQESLDKREKSDPQGLEKHLRDYLSKDFIVGEDNKTKFIAKLLPQHIQISDSVFIYSLYDEDITLNYANAFDTVALRCAQLQHFLMEHGFLLRGGISVGEFCPIRYPDGQRDYIGPAVVRAVDLEKVLSSPCIVLDKELRANVKTRYSTFKTDLFIELKSSDSAKNEILFSEEVMVVNPFSASFGATEIAKYKEGIDFNLHKNLSESAQNKWEWMQTFAKKNLFENTDLLIEWKNSSACHSLGNA